VKILSVAPEEAKKIKNLVTEFLYATHGSWSVNYIKLESIKIQQNQIEVKGTFDSGGLFETKIVSFTILMDSRYRLISYERT